MDALFRLSGARPRDPAVAAWFARGDPLRELVRPWFAMIREGGEDRREDVGELLHDGHPTACIGDAAFAYVDAFSSHAAVGFFHGAALADPARLLEGAGKRMRHVKLRWGAAVDAAALAALVAEARCDIRRRLQSGG